jgi:lipopolysaccharide transport protein LptA
MEPWGEASAVEGELIGVASSQAGAKSTPSERRRVESKLEARSGVKSSGLLLTAARAAGEAAALAPSGASQGIRTVAAQDAAGANALERPPAPEPNRTPTPQAMPAPAPEPIAPPVTEPKPLAVLSEPQAENPEQAPPTEAVDEPLADDFKLPSGAGKLDITANQQTDFDLTDRRVVFSGSVRVKNERFELTSQRLVVYLKPGSQGLDFAEAQGGVVVKLLPRQPREEGAVAFAETAIYRPKTGDITLRGWPKIQQKHKAHVASTATTEMILSTDGRLRTSGRNTTILTP